MFKEKALKDDKLKLFLTKIKKGVYAIDTEKYMNEVKTIHATRMIHTLSKQDIFGSQKAIVDCILENQAKRSRLVTIKSECIRKQNVLQEKIEVYSKYLKAQYANQLRLEFSTQQARNDAVESLFADAKSNTNSIETLIKVIDLIIVDIDQAAWAMKSLVEILKINANKFNEA